MILDELQLLFVAITYGKVSIWLWKNLGIFLSATMWPPCVRPSHDAVYYWDLHRQTNMTSHAVSAAQIATQRLYTEEIM